MRLIFKEDFRFVCITFVKIDEFKSFAQFAVDHLPPTQTCLVLYSCAICCIRLRGD